MDAKVGDWVVTPRIGKPVEINALWYNALRVMERLRAALKDAYNEDRPGFSELTNPLRRSFRERFWYEEGGYLYDVLDGPDGNDPALRPNQLFAISLGKSWLLSKQQARSVLAAVRKRLLTPYGLRTLSPEDPAYQHLYIGNVRKRDGAYHQGTVWTWLLGPYFDAVRVAEGERAARAELQRILPALRAHLADGGLGSISEIFDADAPHEPRGCIAQAWSVAEVLRITSYELRVTN
jgi:predicted glycogen debranching enzyme